MTLKDSSSILKLIEKSRLMRLDEMDEIRQLSEEQPDAQAFLKTLIRQKKLTRWQAGQLMAGNTSFYLGKYKLIELLGAGGMGRVFRAEHTTMNRSVALKIIGRDFVTNSDAQKRFLNEARAIAALNHPNIVHAYSIDKEGDRYYIVMEFVEGQDLEKLIEKEGTLAEERAAKYILQVASALQHAHDHGMIHCDIKPANLLLNESDQVKVLDMGMARLYNVTDSEPKGEDLNQNVLGTVDYMAPEVAEDHNNVSPQSDLYSLGCVFYFLLTGRVPFPGDSLPERILKHQTETPKSPAEWNDKVSDRISDICLKMMAREVPDRYQSAQEIVDCLTKWFAAKSSESVNQDSISLDFTQMISESGSASHSGTRRASDSGSSTVSGLSSTSKNAHGSHASGVGSGASKAKKLPETFTMPDLEKVAAAADDKGTGGFMLPGLPGFGETSSFGTVDTSRERTPRKKGQNKHTDTVTETMDANPDTNSTKSFETADLNESGNSESIPKKSESSENIAMRENEKNVSKASSGVPKARLRVAKSIEDDEAEISDIQLVKTSKPTTSGKTSKDSGVYRSGAASTAPTPSGKAKAPAPSKSHAKAPKKPLPGVAFLKSLTPKQRLIYGGAAGGGLLLLVVGIVLVCVLGGGEDKKPKNGEVALNVPEDVVPEDIIVEEPEEDAEEPVKEEPAEGETTPAEETPAEGEEPAAEEAPAEGEKPAAEEASAEGETPAAEATEEEAKKAEEEAAAAKKAEEEAAAKKKAEEEAAAKKKAEEEAAAKKAEEEAAAKKAAVNPFEGKPAAVSLPKSSDAAEVELLQLDAAGSDLSFSLLGGSSAVASKGKKKEGASSPYFSIEQGDSGDTPTWNFTYTARDAAAKVATLKLDGTSLKFQWDAESTVAPTIRQSLVNCVLEMSCNEKTHNLMLREPLELETLILNPKTGTASIRLPKGANVYAFPDAEVLFVEITRFGQFKPGDNGLTLPPATCVNEISAKTPLKVVFVFKDSNGNAQEPLYFEFVPMFKANGIAGNFGLPKGMATMYANMLKMVQDPSHELQVNEWNKQIQAIERKLEDQKGFEKKAEDTQKLTQLQMSKWGVDLYKKFVGVEVDMEYRVYMDLNGTQFNLITTRFFTEEERAAAAGKKSSSKKKGDDAEMETEDMGGMKF